jgi:hypothetical protein
LKRQHNAPSIENVLADEGSPLGQTHRPQTSIPC